MFNRYRLSGKHHTGILLTIVAVSFFFYAYSTGITGVTQLNGVGCDCHGPNASPSVVVTINGPDSLSPGQVGSYTVTITGGTLTRGGTNVAVSAGVLNTIAGQGMQKIGSELTHTAPKAPAAGVVSFNFNYTAPSVVGTVTMYANGNSVNFNGNNGGDNWNFADNKQIVIRDVVPVELTAFTSVVSGRDVTLSWSTATETNNKGFEVQRASASGNDFSVVAFVSGNGTSAERHEYSFTDNNLANGAFKYRLKQIDFDGTSALYNLSSEIIIDQPMEFSLQQNYPNPFNPSTKINFTLAENSFVSLDVYNVSGEMVASILNKELPAGQHSADLNAGELGLTSGVYIYRIKTGAYYAARKMTLTK